MDSHYESDLGDRVWKSIKFFWSISDITKQLLYSKFSNAFLIQAPMIPGVSNSLTRVLYFDFFEDCNCSKISNTY